MQTWLRAYSSHWDLTHTDEETKQRLDVLGRFCAFYGKGPDELVAWLFRDTPEGPRIRLKRRREVMAGIDEFERAQGGRAAGNLVRSFLIHNGIASRPAPCANGGGWDELIRLVPSVDPLRHLAGDSPSRVQTVSAVACAVCSPVS